MSQIKLELDTLDDTDLAALAQTIITKLTGNANVPAPNPSLAALTALLSALTTAINAQKAADAAAITATAAKNAARAALEAGLTTEAATVQTATLGDPVKVLTTGMGVKSGPTHITSMAPLTSFSVSMGDNKGELDWHCDRADRAKSYNVRICVGAAPGVFTMVPGSSKSKGTLTGLTSGSTVWVQVQALGPNGLTSPWSTAVSSVVP